jgi:hypothetical protein
MIGRGQSPYSIGIQPTAIQKELDTVSQMTKYKQDEKDAKAPHTLPYEMGELPQYFGNMVENGVQAARTLETLLKSENFEHRKELEKLKNNLEKMIVYLMSNVDPILQKFTIGAKEDDFEVDKNKN